MKLIGLVPEANSQQLKASWKAFCSVENPPAAKDKEALKNIDELAVNIHSFEHYEPDTEYLPLAGIICIALKDAGAELGFFNNILKDMGAETILRAAGRRHWNFEKTWKDGESSPGLNRITFVKRKADITREDFSKMWNQHAPLAKEHHPGISRYTQNVILEDSFPFDGIAELHFNSFSDFQERMYKDESSQKIIYQDIERFLDIPAGNRMFAKQHILIS